MISKLDYVQVRKALAFLLERQIGDKATGFVAISREMLECVVCAKGVRVPHNKWAALWEDVTKDLGLVDDGTGTSTVTVPEDVEKIRKLFPKLGEVGQGALGRKPHRG